MERIGYTIDELSSASGLAHGTIYNFTSYGIIPKPVRGVAEDSYQSKGLYPLTAIDSLRRYKQLKQEGKRMADIINIMQTELRSVECTGTAREKENLPGDSLRIAKEA